MAGVGFRWLDILEKEFDKAFVDLDVTIGDLDSDEPDVVYNVRQKMSTLSSCFAQLVHKSQTIFQNSAKIEAELIHMRAELIDSKSKRELLEQELHTLLLQLHSAQLSHLPVLVGGRNQDSKIEPDVNIIKKKLQDELNKSPSHRFTKDDELKFSTTVTELSQLRSENSQMLTENTSLRHTILALNSEVYGAKLAAKYLDKELAGRIQQLQLLGKEMRGEIRDKLWRQLESEILLQRHKTVVRACRRNSSYSNSGKACPKPDITLNENGQDINEIRTVIVKRKTGQGLGISITGGREHGVPILISELEPNGPAALSGNLYIGDAILSVNSVDLRQACHREAVDILQKQSGDCRLEVQYIAADDSDNSLSEDGYNFHYRFFDPEVCGSNDGAPNPYGVLNTPTAPRTPESQNHSRTPSDHSRSASPSKGSSEKMDSVHGVHADGMADNKLAMETKGAEPTAKSDETIAVTDNLIDISTSCLDNPTLIDLNSNPSTKGGLLGTADCDSPSKTLMADLGSRIFENILEPILNPGDTTGFGLDYDISQLGYKGTHFIRMDSNVSESQLDNRNDNFNCSTNSLASENFSSPMQTSTDNMMDSELASNDSHSPKSLQNMNTSSNESEAPAVPPHNFNYGHSLLEIKKFNEFCSGYDKPKLYSSNETFSNPKSDQSLLNSGDSCDSSPVHKVNKDYMPRKSSKKLKTKKTFGVKTLQAIFSKNDGYSDISSTNSDFGDDPFADVGGAPPPPVQAPAAAAVQAPAPAPRRPQQQQQPAGKPGGGGKPAEQQQQQRAAAAPAEQARKGAAECAAGHDAARFLAKPVLTEISPQFEKNIHTFLSETFDRKPRAGAEVALPNFSVSNIGNKKYFMLHGQNLRVGKALRLCPNEEMVDKAGDAAADYKLSHKEKLLARYVYNTNTVNVDGIGDPDFGTPV